MEDKGKIDPTVEKLTYPETKTEYVMNKVIGGMFVGVGIVVVTKVLPIVITKLFRKFDRQLPRN